MCILAYVAVRGALWHRVRRDAEHTALIEVGEATMRKHVSGFLLSVCVWAIGAQADEILIQKPPVYVHGETSAGEFQDLFGRVLTLTQSAEVGERGLTHIRWVIRDSAGRVTTSALVETRTMATELTTSRGDTLRTLHSTCSQSDLYPIFLKKEYECSMVRERNGGVVELLWKTSFDLVRRNAEGEVSEVCSIQEELEDTVLIRSRVCQTADGKWVRSIRVLGITPVNRI